MERCPDVAEHVRPLIDDLMKAREALCHGDFSPKNLLIAPGSLSLVDHETGHLGEPAMDLGFFFSHLLLKSLHLPARREDFAALVRAAWRGYAAGVRYSSPDRLLQRGFRHLGVCVLARIDGTSPVDYLTAEPAREAARRLGRWLLRGWPRDWDHVLQMLASEAR
jgi:5-methylthioribose kinase